MTTQSGRISKKQTVVTVLFIYAGGCSVCPPPNLNSIAENLRDVHIMLDDLTYFANQMTGINNAQIVINQLKSIDLRKQHHGSFTLNVLKNNGTIGDEIVTFEIKLDVDGINYEPDMILFISSNNQIDLKSWKKSSISNIPVYTNLTTLPSQFLGYISSGNFELWFDFKRLEMDFATKVDAENFIKLKFQELYGGGSDVNPNAINIFDSNPDFFASQGILSAAQLRNLAKNDSNFYQSPIFDFVKVK